MGLSLSGWWYRVTQLAVGACAMGFFWVTVTVYMVCSIECSRCQLWWSPRGTRVHRWRFIELCVEHLASWVSSVSSLLCVQFKYNVYRVSNGALCFFSGSLASTIGGDTAPIYKIYLLISLSPILYIEFIRVYTHEFCTQHLRFLPIDCLSSAWPDTHLGCGTKRFTLKNLPSLLRLFSNILNKNFWRSLSALIDKEVTFSGKVKCIIKFSDLLVAGWEDTAPTKKKIYTTKKEKREKTSDTEEKSSVTSLSPLLILHCFPTLGFWVLMWSSVLKQW